MKKILFLTAFIFLSSLKAQVYVAGMPYANYLDVQPDSLLYYTFERGNGGMYSVNMFTGGNDLAIIAYGSSSSGSRQALIKVVPSAPDVYVRMGRMDTAFASGGTGYYLTKVVKPLMYGDVINTQDAQWVRGDVFLTDQSSIWGTTKNVDDFVGGEKYIGVKYIKTDNVTGDQEIFGWIRVNCVSEDSCYIKEMSRSASVVGIRKIQKDRLTILPNPVSDQFSVLNLDDSEGTIELLDMLGKQISIKAVRKNDRIVVNLSPELPMGCYLVKYTSNNQTLYSRIVKAQ